MGDVQEFFAFRGQADGVSFAVKQHNAEPLFQLADAAAECGLSDISFAGGAREALAMRYAEKIFKPL